MPALCSSSTGSISSYLHLSIQPGRTFGRGHRHWYRRQTSMDGSARVAVARQWTVDGLRTQWSALAHSTTLAAPVHALTVTGMSIAAAMLTLRAARLFIRSVPLYQPVHISEKEHPPPPPPPFSACIHPHKHSDLPPIRVSCLSSQRSCTPVVGQGRHADRNGDELHRPPLLVLWRRTHTCNARRPGFHRPGVPTQRRAERERWASRRRRGLRQVGGLDAVLI